MAFMRKLAGFSAKLGLRDDEMAVGRKERELEAYLEVCFAAQ